MINQQLDHPLGPRLLSVDVKIIFLGTPPGKATNCKSTYVLFFIT